MAHKHTNDLIKETSPYLLQHAHNPVDWKPWKPEVLAEAQKKNKPLLISIGYAACHWCHVMEEECFEDEEVAQYMNKHFVNIKIDREERPDVDQIYMDAIQMMSGNGGWPLNIVALPDGRPFWGATYLPKESWLKSLQSLTQLYTEDIERVSEYATNLEQGIKAINLVEPSNDSGIFTLDSLEQAVTKWSGYFDTYLGGYKRAPKFMMPNNLEFLLHYGTSQNDQNVLDYVNTTLTRMAYGGIFDHVGGGFSRYSVDTKWHVPHFEKMLYDNGQLVSLYAKAYAVTKNPLYKQVVDETVAFVKEELTDENGGFYSSLDADSQNNEGELEEGAYYVWTEKELKSILGAHFEVFKDYYNINSYGHWEDGIFVLIRDKTATAIADKHELSETQLLTQIASALEVLKGVRETRPKPRLDDKILTSWNGLMMQGLIDSYRHLGEDAYLKMALNNAEFINRNMMTEDGGLLRNHKNGTSSINAFLDDYAAIIEAFISLYEVTFDMDWLEKAKKLTEYCKRHFQDPKTQLFYYTSDEDEALIRRSMEINDNVISSSNSIMAKNIFRLHKLFPEQGYGTMAKRMVKNMQQNFSEHPQGYANWLHLVLYEQKNFYEIAVVGENYEELGEELAGYYIPNSILAGSREEASLELFKNRYVADKTLVYVCIEGTCKLPVTESKEVLTQINSFQQD